MLFLVAGDHGMTQGGDHGGSSADEANAGLFVSVPCLSLSLSWLEGIPLSFFPIL